MSNGNPVCLIISKGTQLQQFDVEGHVKSAGNSKCVLFEQVVDSAKVTSLSTIEKEHQIKQMLKEIMPKVMLETKLK